ncbi:MAG: hypothetical protein FWC36_09075 [Spirochaetes bacterium]|nr:hypothetical protein [Spirochaetota bacterium]
MNKKKGFVCQNCEKAVPANKERCPHCGRFFKGVRCPKCFFVGGSNDFLKGCPSCGYLEDEAGNPDFHNHKKNKTPRTIPLWFLLFSAAFLILLIIILIYIFLKM